MVLGTSYPWFLTFVVSSARPAARVTTRRALSCPSARVQSSGQSSVSARSGAKNRLTREPPSLGVSCSTTLSVCGSDQHRVCLTQLCCVSRFSQPPDAFFHQHPSGLVSCRLRPRAFAFRGFPLPVAAAPLGAPYPSPALSFRSTARRILASGRSVLDGPVLPKPRRSILSWRSPLRGFLPPSLDSVFTRSLLSWASTPR